eukprot:m.222963 g.222963  ORF g.222963 m.222963 type:complete len:101 (+) comp16141_c0_seq1:23-325(+)
MAQKCGLAYDAEAAKHGVEKVWDQLKHLEALVAGEPAPDKVHEAAKLYRELPSYQINWSLVGVNEADAQKKADDVRDKINSLNQKAGANSIPLGRAFGAH